MTNFIGVCDHEIPAKIYEANVVDMAVGAVKQRPKRK